MASAAFSTTTEPRAAIRLMPRRHLLHTCGISILAIAHKASTRVQDFNGPIGKMAKRISTLLTSAFPFICAIQYHWLAVLSFIDDHILVVEDLIETLFPPSTHLFNKIDKLIQVAESLPGKFDDAMDKFSMIIHQVPFVDWAMAYLTSWLKFLNATLTHWGSAREKEIVIDINCNGLNKSAKNNHSSMDSPNTSQCENVGESKTSGNEHCPVESSMSCSSGESKTVTKCSYKEILEKGAKENSDKKEDSAMEEAPKTKSDEGIVPKDPILDLFEASWQMNSGKGNPLPLPIVDT